MWSFAFGTTGSAARRVFWHHWPSARSPKGQPDMSVTRLGYMHARVTDLAEARRHYSDTLGLRITLEEPGKLYLKAWDEYDHHSVVLEEGGVGMVKMGYKV